MEDLFVIGEGGSVAGFRLKKKSISWWFRAAIGKAAAVFLILVATSAGAHPAGGQKLAIPANRILSDAELLAVLRPNISALAEVYRLRDRGDTLRALKKLAAYLKRQAKLRYYFSWAEMPRRLREYRNRYPDAVREHLVLAQKQISTYPPEPQWQLPFRDLHGRVVTAYRLRHLARQQLAPDLAFAYYFSGRDRTFLRYFVRQVASLNHAFSAGEYQQGGNDVYERFRAGKRVHNWLFTHNLFLADSAYTWRDQLLLVRTLLHHGAQLARRTRKFSRGNHHTKGLVGLFQIAVLFRDFQDTEAWREQALRGIVRHLRLEVNDDGFQFERSVHYHIGDIDNYFRVFQLARLNDIRLPGEFVSRFRSMFEALVKLALPDAALPVLQDCTDRPYAEEVLPYHAMALGALLFNDPIFRYFAGPQIPPDLFWYFSLDAVRRFARMPRKPPELGSLTLQQTGYYVMRNGWTRSAEYLVVDAGLSAVKPDHQQAGALGLEAYANGHEVLPNYQVAYSHPDYPFWKSSWVKNVALVDSIPLGRGWRPNRGGSGFGKWHFLARPEVLVWLSRPKFDYFVGTHNGYDSLGVHCLRTVWFVKDGFWLVRDEFVSDTPHRYQQVWQGRFDEVIPRRLLRKSYPDGSGLDLLQLGGVPERIFRSEHRGKANLVVESPLSKKWTYETLVFPFASEEEAIHLRDESSGRAGNWQFNPKKLPFHTDAIGTLRRGDAEFLLLRAQFLSVQNETVHFANPVDLFLQRRKKGFSMTVLAEREREIQFSGSVSLRLNGKPAAPEAVQRVSPGDHLEVIP